MRIENLHPEPPGGSLLARFDCHVTETIRLNGLLLRRNAAGEVRMVAPNLRGSRVASVAPELAAEITTAAVAALSTINGRAHAHVDRNSH